MRRLLSKREKIQVRLAAVEQLIAIKKHYKYRELEKELGIPASVLARYIKGGMAPSPYRALEIMRKIRQLGYTEKILEKNLIRDPRGFLNMSQTLHDPSIVKLLAYTVLLEETGWNKVLSLDLDSIPLASLIASVTNSFLIVCSRERRVGGDHVEEVFFTDSPPFVAALYVPAGAVGKGDRILITTSVLRTGRTVEAAINLVSRLGGEISEIVVVASVGEAWKPR